jgi:hypothetical protein
MKHVQAKYQDAFKPQTVIKPYTRCSSPCSSRAVPAARVCYYNMWACASVCDDATSRERLSTSLSSACCLASDSDRTCGTAERASTVNRLHLSTPSPAEAERLPPPPSNWTGTRAISAGPYPQAVDPNHRGPIIPIGGSAALSISMHLLTCCHFTSGRPLLSAATRGD